MTGIFSIYIGILGLIAGSFLGMLIPRLHFNEKGIFFGRSKCPNCNKKLKAIDLIPLVSFIALRGKCRSCKKEIAIWYPIIEASTSLMFFASAIFIKDFKTLLLTLPLLLVVIFIFFYDLRYKEIHDAVMIPGIIWGIIVSVVTGTLASSLIGALIGLAFFGAQYLISKGKWIGSGDIIIGIFMGITLGLANTIIAIMAGYLLGSIIGIFLLITKRADKKTTVPLGPFLAIGTIIAYTAGEKIINFYLI